MISSYCMNFVSNFGLSKNGLFFVNLKLEDKWEIPVLLFDFDYNLI